MDRQFLKICGKLVKNKVAIADRKLWKEKLFKKSTGHHLAPTVSLIELA